MATPLWKKMKEVAIEIAAATIVIVTTVFIERCLRPVSEKGAGSVLERDVDEKRSKPEGSKSDDR